MNESIGRGFRRLTIAAAAAIYALMVAGGVVRITGSGMGCPDWPLCHGQVVPPLELTAIIEYTHRSAALIGGTLVIAVAAMALMRYRSVPRILIPAMTVIALLAVQVPLGALVVASELSSMLVAFHLGMALLIFASTLTTALAANRSAQRAAEEAPRSYRALIGTTMVALFVLLLTGAMVVGVGVSQVCTGWPLCGLPGVAAMAPGAVISMYHRYVVAAVSVLIVATVVQSLRLPRMRLWAAALGGMFAAQIAVGALQVLLGLPPLWRVLHLAVATGVWASLVGLMNLTFAGARAVLPHVDAGASTIQAASGR